MRHPNSPLARQRHAITVAATTAGFSLRGSIGVERFYSKPVWAW
jgi:hypothetical protein